MLHAFCLLGKKNLQLKKDAQSLQCGGHSPRPNANLLGTWTLMPLRAGLR